MDGLAPKLLLLVAMAAVAVLARGPPAPNTYRVAAAETVAIPQFGLPVSRTTALAGMEQILRERFEPMMKNASSMGVQMIVFPEDSLYGDTFVNKSQLEPYLDQLPLPDVATPLCTSSTNMSAAAFPTLRATACLAVRYNMTLVYGGGDRQPCSRATDPQCPAEGWYSFNTQIALHPNGTLASKYHKTHLFTSGDSQYDPNPRPAPVSFVSAFGVRFGQLVCFDVLFRSPASELAAVRHVLLSSFWCNNCSTPPMSAIAAQQGYSRATNTTLIGCGTAQGRGASGSGVYVAGEPIVYHRLTVPQSVQALVVADVPYDADEEAHAIAAAASGATPPPPPPSPSLLPRTPLLGLGRRRVVADPVWPTGAAVASFAPAQLPSDRITTFKLSYPSSSSSSSSEPALVECRLDVTPLLNGSAAPAETYALMAFAGLWFNNSLTNSFCALVFCDAGDCGAGNFASTTLFSNVALTLVSSPQMAPYPVVPIVSAADNTLIPASQLAFVTTPTWPSGGFTVGQASVSTSWSTTSVSSVLLYGELE